MQVDGYDVIFFYVKCRRCGKTICMPATSVSDRARGIFHCNEDPITVDNEYHPNCKLLYPKHFETLVDLIYYSYDDPDIQTAEDLNYDVDFTPYELFKEEVEKYERQDS